jgi:hypothetical protein
MKLAFREDLTYTGVDGMRVHPKKVTRKSRTEEYV